MISGVHQFRHIAGVIFFSVLFFTQAIFAQDSSATAVNSEVRITCQVDKKQVPLNRTLKLTVRVEWSGDINRYQIGELEDPILKNLQIISTSSADLHKVEGGTQKAARIYEFTLKPQTLGMAYIEQTMLTYIDVESGEGHTLKTNRIDVEVIESVPEPGQKRGAIYRYPVIGLVVLIFGIIAAIIGRKQKRKKKEQEIIPVKSLEEEFLDHLHKSLSVNRVQADISEGYYLLSRIARRYLKEKYKIDALELTTDEILKTLSDRDDVDEAMAKMIDEILRTCDLAKFSGSHGDISEFQRLYTLFESVLEKNHMKSNGSANGNAKEDEDSDKNS